MPLLAIATITASISCPGPFCYTPPSPPLFSPLAGTFTLPALAGRAHLVLPPLSNTSLDFTGVTLVCGDRAGAGIYLGNWAAVSLTGLNLRYARPPSSTAAITAVAGGGVLDVAVEAGHPLDDFVAGTVASCNFFDAATRQRKPLAQDLYVTSVKPLGPPSAFRLVAANSGQLEGIVAGDLIGCRVVGGGMTMNIDGAERCAFTNITLYGGPCFGFLEGGGHGGNTYTNISIRFPDPPPGALYPPLLSTSADGFHSSGVRRGPRIEGALFEGMDDDGIAVHGGFMLVTDAAPAAGGGRVWATVHGALRSGDAVFFYDKSFAPAPLPQPPSFVPTAFTVLSVEPAAQNYTPPFQRITHHALAKAPRGDSSHHAGWGQPASGVRI